MPGYHKEQFIEGLALVNTLPGPVGIQLGIFLGYTRAGWWGGVLAWVLSYAPDSLDISAGKVLERKWTAVSRQELALSQGPASLTTVAHRL
ncbi:MAG: chromate transporter [Nitrospinae bacterium]|nr:chromate transporter [Nitrospinota bacterium]